jgi:hypothetical protein
VRAQDTRLNAVSESVANMKALKVYAWVNHFREVVRGLRESELGLVDLNEGLKDRKYREV